MNTVAHQLQYDPASLDGAVERLGLRMVVLFGSWASGDPPPGPDSDVDLALAFTSPARTHSLWDCHTELAPAFPDMSLDLAFLADTDPLFRWEIMRDGILLDGEPLDYLEFRAFAFRDFVDSADLRALEAALFDKKLDWIRRRLDAAP